MPSDRKRATFARSEACEEEPREDRPFTCRRTIVQGPALGLSLKRRDAVGDRNPALRTLHPDEVVWPEPGCVIKGAGFEGEHVLRVRNMIEADSAIGTEHTLILAAAVSDTRK